MKKLILTSAIILGISLTTFADGGLFNRGNNARYGPNSGFIYFNAQDAVRQDVNTPLLPPHGSDERRRPAGQRHRRAAGPGCRLCCRQET